MNVKLWYFVEQKTHIPKDQTAGLVTLKAEIVPKEWKGPIHILNVTDLYEQKDPEIKELGMTRLFEQFAGKHPDIRDQHDPITFGELLLWRNINIVRVLFRQDIGLKYPYWFALAYTWEKFFEFHQGITIIFPFSKGVEAAIPLQCLNTAKYNIHMKNHGFSQYDPETSSRKFFSYPLIRGLAGAATAIAQLRHAKKKARSLKNHREIAFWPFRNKVSQYILPLYQEWERIHPNSSYIISRYETHQDWFPSNCQTIHPYNYVDISTIITIIKESFALKKKYSSLIEDTNIKKLFRWKEWDFFQLFKKDFDLFFLRYLEPNLVSLASIINWVQKEKMKTIILPHDGTNFIRGFVAAANSAGANILGIMWAIQSEIGDPLETHLCVYSEPYLKEFLKLGFSKEKFSLTGSPAYLNIENQKEKKLQKKIDTCQTLGINSHQALIVFATSFSQPGYPEQVKRKDCTTVILGLKKLSDLIEFEFITKLHPQDSSNGIMEKSLSQECSFSRPLNIIQNSTITNDLIASADLLITIGLSSIANIAIAANTPLVIVYSGGVSQTPAKEIIYVDDNIAPVVDNENDLCSEALAAIQSPKDYFQRWGQQIQIFKEKQLQLDAPNPLQAMCQTIMKLSACK